jgi:uncharacterized damage-inducible protein DinB
MQPDTPEVWLRGPLDGVPPLLQPVGHALLQAREEVNEILVGFPQQLLWERPAGVASVGFHLRHLAGVLDRLFTYAKGLSLTPEQLSYLQAEKYPPIAPHSVEQLVYHFNNQVEIALNQLRDTPEQSLLQPVGVGRKKLPSNVLGLLFHAAEHTQRHTGQLLVTARILHMPTSNRQ